MRNRARSQGLVERTFKLHESRIPFVEQYRAALLKPHCAVTVTEQPVETAFSYWHICLVWLMGFVTAFVIFF